MVQEFYEGLDMGIWESNVRERQKEIRRNTRRAIEALEIVEMYVQNEEFGKAGLFSRRAVEFCAIVDTHCQRAEEVKTLS